MPPSKAGKALFHRSPKRKYEVCGTDDLGDVHIFCTDDRERAEEVADVMREDLDEVELTEN